jgi:hypothetical protein
MVGPPSGLFYYGSDGGFLFGGINMKCPKCATKNRDDADVCRKCGQRLAKPEPPESGNISYDWRPLAFTVCIAVIFIVILKVFFKM